MLLAEAEISGHRERLWGAGARTAYDRRPPGQRQLPDRQPRGANPADSEPRAWAGANEEGCGYHADQAALSMMYREGARACTHKLAVIRRTARRLRLPSSRYGLCPSVDRFRGCPAVSAIRHRPGCTSRMRPSKRSPAPPPTRRPSGQGPFAAVDDRIARRVARRRRRRPHRWCRPRRRAEHSRVLDRAGSSRARHSPQRGDHQSWSIFEDLCTRRFDVQPRIEPVQILLAGLDDGGRGEDPVLQAAAVP